jgi:hypothetical protein
MDAIACVRQARTDAEFYEQQDEAYKAHLKEQKAEEERLQDEAAPEY